MFTLCVTPVGQALSASFKNAAKVGDFPSALSNLQGLNMSDALISCLDLFDDDQTTYAKLVQAVGAATGRPQFSITLVNKGCVAAGSYEGIKYLDDGEGSDLLSARIFILQVRGFKGLLANRLWAPAADLASTQPFYPD